MRDVDWWFQETRKNILDEWGDEEEDESDEKKRINETLGRSSGGEGSDDEDGDSVHGEGTWRLGTQVDILAIQGILGFATMG